MLLSREEIESLQGLSKFAATLKFRKDGPVGLPNCATRAEISHRMRPGVANLLLRIATSC